VYEAPLRVDPSTNPLVSRPQRHRNPISVLSVCRDVDKSPRQCYLLPLKYVSIAKVRAQGREEPIKFGIFCRSEYSMMSKLSYRQLHRIFLATNSYRHPICLVVSETEPVSELGPPPILLQLGMHSFTVLPSLTTT
jgi:hypothetical protein